MRFVDRIDAGQMVIVIKARIVLGLLPAARKTRAEIVEMFALAGGTDNLERPEQDTL